MAANEQASTIVVMAGGTGGHIFPALATATELAARGYNVHWLGTADSMEAELVPQYGFGISFIPVTGLRRTSIKFLLKAPWCVGVSLLKAMAVLKRQQPICVLGMGGYVTGPGGIAAKLMGVPLIIHEQNAVPGLTNRLLSLVASRVLEAFPNTFSKKKTFGMKKTIFTTGNPVRASMCQQHSYVAGKPLKLLVLGGSRGAVAINNLMPQVFVLCQGRLNIFHQAGKNNIDQCLATYKELSVQVGDSCRVEAFIDDMAQAYAWADIVLCRSGALTVSELAAVGRPAILVPYPYAVDDHQTVNGHYLVDQGAALMIQQNQLDENCLATLLMDLESDPARLESMAVSAKAAGRIHAAQVVADHCLEVCDV